MSVRPSWYRGILFRNTREAIQGFPGRDCQPAPLPAPEDWSKDGKLREQCGQKKPN